MNCNRLRTFLKGCEEMKFSVLVVTYNSELPKLFCTLQSILVQEFDDFEIVISDDASRENHFSEIERFFAERGFENYQLVSHEKNQGTVRNFISGLDYVTGKYVKFLSAGDTFYSEHTMGNIYNYMEETGSAYCFGLMQGYRRERDGTLVKVNFFHPFDLQSYRRRDEKKIVKNLVLYSDHVCGAAVCGEKNFCVEYLNKICGCVVYEEDIMQVLAAVESRPIDFIDDYVVWYEVGSGASSHANARFAELLRRDVAGFYEMLYLEYGNGRYEKYIKKRHGLSGIYRVKNLYARTFLRFFVNPDSLRYFISALRQRRHKVHMLAEREVGLLEKEEFWDSAK